VKVDPREDRVGLAMGRVYYKLKDYTQALTSLYRANRENDDFENHLYIAQALEALGKTNEAEAEFQLSQEFGKTK
jgi:uncharacterized protein HemY